MAEKRYEGMAIASFVLGLCGLIPFFFLIPSILAIIFGFVSLNRIKHNKALKGKAFAWWGIGLGIGIIVLAIFFLLLTIPVMMNYGY